MRAAFVARIFAEIATRDEKTQDQIGTLAETVLRKSKRIDFLMEIAIAMRDDIRIVSIAVDRHTDRLDRIEQHLGLDNLTH